MLSCRLQELEDQYRREREEATYLLEQQRLVRMCTPLSKPLYALAHQEGSSLLPLAVFSAGRVPPLHSSGLG